ncbi:uncharacterized protein Tco025E_06882 [Trypanosoma conorhini]|uniref:C3H1-type domain-containing protein n=1 Tax=Trypanosoma conorhini TaxID=83891 RepID=A0A3R7KLM9_9TRYP|nr:uncharacterized protein Tco025E_06882 [Trypanosoma conorhini]RNF09929.1 hypothetical protein Tco025E_06882 [Trypanosoma conorhini]
MELNCIGAMCAAISGETAPANEGPCKSTQESAAVEAFGHRAVSNVADPSFRQKNLPEDEDTSRMPKDEDTFMASFSSSLCLTEAVQTTTNTLGSSTFSGASVFQNSANALAVLRETGTKKLLASLGSEVVGPAAESCCDAPLFPNYDSHMDPASAPPPSPKHETAAKDSCWLAEGGDIFALLHLQPETAADGIWKSDATKEDSLAKDDESCLEMPQVLPIPSSASSEFLESVTEERFDCMHDKEIKEKVILVVDPRRSKLHVPLSAISPTRALEVRAQNPSLCLLFQSGRCRQGANCHQVHVDPEVVERLRRIVDSLPCCCTFHGDCNTHCWNAKANAKRNLVISGVVVPLSRVAFTNGLTRFVTGTAQRPLSRGVLCRLHGKPGGCRYGADCWYLHVCREILEREFAVVVGSQTTNSITEASAVLSPNLARKGLSVTRDVHATSLSTQQRRPPSSFLSAETPSLAVTTAPFSIQDHKNNGGVSTAFVSHGPAVPSAIPCVWVHPNSLPQKPVPTFAGVAAAGDAGLPRERLLQATVACAMPSQGGSSMSLPRETAVSVSTLSPHNRAAFTLPMQDRLATSLPMPPTPQYRLVQQTPVAGITGVQLNSSTSAEYHAMGFQQQQAQQQQQQQHGPQTYLFQQAPSMTLPPAFIVSSAVYASHGPLEGFVQPQANVGPGMAFLPVTSYSL